LLAPHNFRLWAVDMPIEIIPGRLGKFHFDEWHRCQMSRGYIHSSSKFSGTSPNVFKIVASPKFPMFASPLLSLPEIKSGRIDGAILPGAAWRRCCQLPEPPARPGHPCPALGGCEPRCNISDTIRAGGEDAARQIQQHDPGSPAGSSRSAVPHIRFAMAIALQSADRECPLLEGGG
jgi:hypothetical protein